MSRVSKLAVPALAVLVVAGLIAARSLAQATSKPAADNMQCQKMCAENIPAALKAVDAARKAIEGGDSKAALEQLDTARKLLAQINETMAAPVVAAGKFVNVRCPITGGSIDPAKATEATIRDYKGQKVAFCCPMCPPKWDKMTDAQKDAALAKVKAPAADAAQQAHEHQEHE